MNWKRPEENFTQTKESSSKINEGVKNAEKVSVDSTPILKLNSNDGKEFLCGLGSAVINVAVTYPINKIIFRQVK